MNRESVVEVCATYISSGVPNFKRYILPTEPRSDAERCTGSASRRLLKVRDLPDLWEEYRHLSGTLRYHSLSNASVSHWLHQHDHWYFAFDLQGRASSFSLSLEMRSLPAELRRPRTLPPQVPKSIHGRSAQAPVQQTSHRPLPQGLRMSLLVGFSLSLFFSNAQPRGERRSEENPGHGVHPHRGLRVMH